jgi:hypothetical protein
MLVWLRVDSRGRSLAAPCTPRQKMRIPKKYGESAKQDCPFCGDFAIAANEQGVPTCLKHKETLIENFKCICGDWLDLLKGKFGPYFRCMRCGNVNFKRALEINQQCLYKREKTSTPPAGVTRQAPELPTPIKKKEIVIRSDELDFWFD